MGFCIWSGLGGSGGEGGKVNQKETEVKGEGDQTSPGAEHLAKETLTESNMLQWLGEISNKTRFATSRVQ